MPPLLTLCPLFSSICSNWVENDYNSLAGTRPILDMVG